MNESDGYIPMLTEDCLQKRLELNASYSDFLENISVTQTNGSVLGAPLRLLEKYCYSVRAELEVSTGPPTSILSRPLVVMEAVALGLMILITIGGNMLVIVAVMTNATLRSPTHSLIVNLAVADLLLGVTVLPLSAVRELSGVWLMGSSLCSIWTALDVLCCTASILSLCVISVDRYIGVSRPLAYSRILTKKRARWLIVGIWALALAISIGPPLGWREEAQPEEEESDVRECHVNKQLGYVIFSACGSFYLPALIILALYTQVYRAAVRHSKFLLSGSRVTSSDVTLRVHVRNNIQRASISEGHSTERSTNNCAGSTLLHDSAADRTNDGAALRYGGDAGPFSEDSRRLTISGLNGRLAKFRRQKKAAKTLGIVVGGFLLCWFPFFVLLPVDAACTTCDIASLFNFAFWLGYFNSCINPFIYACSSRELRRAFRGILCCKRKNSNNMTVGLTSRSNEINMTSVMNLSTIRRAQWSNGLQ